LGGLGIHDVSRLSLPAARDWLKSLDLSPTETVIASRPRTEILQRLDNLLELGLAYLTLERSAHSLSGGEAQRIRLAHQLSSSLSGVLYILDEPSVGLHPHDHAQLLDILFRLRETGNTVVVVEHDRQAILRADYVVDMGPGAGSQGGEVVFAGSPKALAERVDNLTGLYLSRCKSLAPVAHRRTPAQGFLSVLGARGHNLKGFDAHFPIGCLTCVTGVSGSGKSTLVLHTLHRAMAKRLYGSNAEPAPCEGIKNSEAFTRVVLVDQSPIGRTSRSTPATYTGIFTHVREIFSQVPESRARGYGAVRFSFNAKGGRCETCRGEGVQRIEMLFLPDVSIQCPACGGTRYKEETLEIKYKGYSIADLLRMSVQECRGILENIPSVRHRLETLLEVGLGYILLGQPGTSLSGGEAQRVKLAAELGRRSLSRALYILDEPTTGLHLDDILKLLHLLQKLVDQGHTVILIEHHPEVIRAADHVIDLGPGGGDAGGHIVVAGSPDEVANAKESLTGKYLRDS
jgi:excinuclease ABC subunit A